MDEMLDYELVEVTHDGVSAIEVGNIEPIDLPVIEENVRGQDPMLVEDQ